jgi:hypothetical protein
VLLGLLGAWWTPAPAFAQSVEVPPDPFAGEYQIPEEREVGTAAGQLRFMGSAGLADREGLGIDLQATVEKMGQHFMGVRFTSALSAWSEEERSPGVWSFTIGPGFHFLPYRVVDLGLFLEGGLAIVEPFEGIVAPVVTPGLTIDVALDSAWFFHVEGQMSWLVFEDTRNDGDGLVHDALWLRALVGLGYEI